MIYESSPWKKRLHQHGCTLTKLRRKNRLSEDDLVVVEETVMAGAFATRKLLESEKLSKEVEALVLGCESYPAIVRQGPEWSGVSRMLPSAFDRHDVDRYFDLEKSAPESVQMKYFLNQVIHSLFFEIGFNEDENLDFIWVCSDHRAEKGNGLLHIPIEEVIRLFDTVANDDIIRSFSQRDPKTWKMKSRRLSTR